MAASSNEITFWQGNVQISTRLLEGRYPDYKQLIPDHYPEPAPSREGDLLGGPAPGAAAGAGQHDTGASLDAAGRGRPERSRARTWETPQRPVDGDYTGEDLVIAFNPSYLIDGVEAVVGDEVIVETADASRAATVRGAEDDSFRYLLMPVRVS